MAEVLHPFLQDVINSGGKATFADAERYARAQYEGALENALASDKWSEEEAIKHTAEFINQKYGFNFADTEEQQQARMEWLQSLGMPPQADQRKAIDSMAADASKASIQDAEKAHEELVHSLSGTPKSDSKSGVYQMRRQGRDDFGLRLREYTASVDNDSIIDAVSRGLSMGIGDSAAYKAGAIAFASPEYISSAKQKMKQQQSEGPLGFSGNFAYMAAKILGDLPVAVPAGAVGTAAAVPIAAATGPAAPFTAAAAGGAAAFCAIEHINATWDLIDNTVVPVKYTGNDAVDKALYIAGRDVQGAIVGGVTGGVSRVVGLGYGADAAEMVANQALRMGASNRAANAIGALTNHGVQIPVETAAFVGTEAILNGHMPTAEEFWSAAAFVGTSKLSGFYTGKLHKWYRDSGFQPQSVLRFLKNNPTLAAIIRSTNLAGLQKQYGEHTPIWVLRPNQPNQPVLPEPVYPDTPQGRRARTADQLRNRREFIAERLGLTRENYDNWARATAEQVATGIVNDGQRPSGLYLDTEGKATTRIEAAGKRDAHGRPDPEGRVDEPIPSYEKWLRGQLRLFEVFSEASQDIKANAGEAAEAGINPDTLRRLKKESPHFEIADPEQQAIIQSMATRYDSASEAWFNMQHGSMSLGAERPLVSSNTMIRGEYGDIAENSAIETARRLNEANKVDDPNSPQAYAPHEVIVSNEAKVQFVKGRKEKQELAELFFAYVDSTNAPGEPSYRALFGTTVKGQAEELFKEMPLRFQQWLRQGHGVANKSKASQVVARMNNDRVEHTKEMERINKQIKELDATIMTPEQVMERTYGKDKVAAQERKLKTAEANAKALREKDAVSPETGKRIDELKKRISEYAKERKAVRAQLDEEGQSRGIRQRNEDRLIKLDRLLKLYGETLQQATRETAPRYAEEIAQYDKEALEAKTQLDHWRQQADVYSKARYADEIAAREKLNQEAQNKQAAYEQRYRQGRKEIEDRKRKYVTPDIYTPETDVQMLNIDGKFFILDPTIIREKPAVDFSLQNVYEAAAGVGKQVSVGEESPNPNNARITYAAMIDRVSPLNQVAKLGELTVPYIAARQYAGADGIANLWLEDGRTLFAKKSAASDAGTNPEFSGGLSLANIRGHIDQVWKDLKGEVHEAIEAIASGLDANMQESLKQDLTVLAGAIKEIAGKKGKAPADLEAWFAEVSAAQTDSARAKAETSYWKGSKGKDAQFMFRVFAIAKHAQELQRNGIPHGFNDAQVNILADSPLMNKVYGVVLDEIRDYQYALLDYQVDAGLISKERALAIKGQYKYYVPFERVQVEVADQVPWWKFWERKSHEETADQAPRANIIDPIEAIARSTFSVIRAAEKNQVIRLTAELYGTRARVEGEDISLGDLFDFHEQQASNKNLEAKRQLSHYENGKEIKTQVANDVAEAIDSLGTATANVYANVLHRYGAAISGLLRIGATLTPKFFFTNIQRDFMEAYIQSESGFNPLASVVDGLKAVVSKKTNGAMFPNMKPLYDEWQLSGGQYSTIVARDRKPVQEALHDLSKPKLWRDTLTTEQKESLEAARTVARRRFEKDQRSNFKRYRDELVELLPDKSKAEIDAIFENTKPNGLEHYLAPEMLRLLQRTERPYNSVPLTTYGLQSLMHLLSPKNILGNLQEFASISEEGTRIGEFIASRRMGRSIMESGYRSREITIDFARMGSAVQGLNSLVTFLNANIQGTDRFFRAMRNNPLSAASKIVSGLVIPGLTFALLREEYKATAPEDDELAAYLKRVPDYVYQNNFVIPDPINKTAWLIKKPFEYSAVSGNPLESFIRFAYEKDPSLTWWQNMVNDGTINNIQDQFWMSGSKFTEAFSLQAVDPVLNLRSNYNKFTGQPIIPASQLSEVPYVMYGKNTTEIYKELSYMSTQFLDKVGLLQFADPKFLSPTGMEYLVQGYTATLGRDIMYTASKGLEKVGALSDTSKAIQSARDIPFISAFQVRNPGYNAQSIRNMFNALEKMDASNRAAKRLFKEGSEFSLKAAEGLVYAKTPFITRTRKAMVNAINTIKFIEARKDIDDAEKYAEIEKHTKALIAMSENGLQQIKQIEEQAKAIWVKEVQRERQRRGYANTSE